MTLNDAILAATGGPTVNDGLRAYYNAQGVPYGALQDMERAFLRIQMPVAEGSNQDLWMQYLSGVWGYEGTLNDMLLQYWLAVGSIGLSWQDMVDLYFSNGENGVIYPLNPAEGCVFQDAIGTVPCTGPDQPVGLALDVSGNGNHASQPTTTKQARLGREPFGGRRNLLTYTEDFENAVWVKSGGTVASGSSFTETATSGQHSLYEPLTVPDGTYTGTARVKGTGVRYVSLRVDNGAAPYCVIDIQTGLVSDGSGATGTLNPDGSCSIVSTRTLGAEDKYFTIDLMAGPLLNQFIYLGNASNSLEIYSAQLELGSTTTPYQKVVSSFDVTEAGVPDVWYIKGDGIDDFLSTANVDFTGTDKMTVWTGMRKISVSTSHTVVELSVEGDANNGAFFIRQPAIAMSRGTINVQQSSPIAENESACATMQTDIAAPLLRLTKNGVWVAGSTATQGTGNFGNYPLYLLSRAGSALFFDGYLYSLMIRGAETTDLTPGNEYTAALTGVTLP